MRLGTRYGVVLGCAVQPLLMTFLDSFTPRGVVAVPWWLPVAGPVALWLGIEMAGRVRRSRWLSNALVLVALLGAVVWWWWMYSLFAWHHVITQMRLGVPTAIVVAYTVAAVASTRSLTGRRAASDRSSKSEELESISH
jgi:hypothetical protein